jgi:hypothetical protein
MKALGCIACAALLGYAAVSCSSSPHEPSGDHDTSRVVYTTSFESARDTTGWIGITERMFQSDPAPDCGNLSLHIGGGCIQPTAYFVLPPRPYSAKYKISCWGRLDSTTQRGTLALTADAGNGSRREAALVVDSEEWTYFTSKDLLRCPAGQELRLEIRIGGFVAASMSVDCLTVEMVE